MGYSLQVFVSSTCYELRDLRATVKEWLEQRSIVPIMSEEGGFPHIDGMPPYATCLRALEECPLSIIIIDRQYGQTFDDWGPYPQYSGLSPTHAEICHTLERGIRALIYVQADTLNFYEVWRKNSDAFKESLPKGLNEATLKMIHELKTRKPAPWIERFNNVSDLLNSLNSELVNQLYSHLHDRQKQTIDLAAYLLGKISEAAPEVRKQIENGLTPSLVVERDTLQRQLVAIESELKKAEDSSKAKITALEHEKADAQTRLDTVEQQLTNMSLLLARAAMKDASWLGFIRKTMMPKQPGRVPFHNSAEVALRGYHTAGSRMIPVLHEVTWSRLQYNENGLHRGYKAGIVFKGSGFVPGITFTHRRRGQVGPPPGNEDYFWHLPNIYFGDYLEVSTNDDEVEAPLSWRDYEFQVKNPEGQKSEWVLFTYSFDYELLKSIQRESFQQGNELLEQGRSVEAIEPLRKAYVFADRLLGIEHKETLRVKSVWEQARNEAALARLRFSTGDRITVLDGPHEGKVGVIKELLLNHLHAYLIKSDVGDDFQASDAQVEREQLD